MELRFKLKVLLCFITFFAICGLDCRIRASMLEDHVHPPGARNEHGINDRLFVSVGIGSAQSVATDLHRGADVHALDGSLQTPLHFAIRRIFEARFLEGSLDVLDVLLGNGADPNFRVNPIAGRNVQTPYEYFETHYANDVDQVLVENVRTRLNNF